jgi:hypothetical protein
LNAGTVLVASCAAKRWSKQSKRELAPVGAPLGREESNTSWPLIESLPIDESFA